ncbi:MAG: hypothetical protein J0L64_06540 [Acidobacteria bacterium]|nr:hypothetical protein [Acidobacteriota bacterium]
MRKRDITEILEREDHLALGDSRGRRLHAALRAAWCALVLLVVAGSLIPGSTVLIRAVDSLQVDDQWIHLSAYFLLSLLPAVHERPAVALNMGALAVLLGFAIECGQIFVADRTFQWADAAANAAGVVMGASSGRALCRLAERLAAR